MERINKVQHRMSKAEFLEARLDALEGAVTPNVLKVDQATLLAIQGYMNGEEVNYIYNENSNTVMVKVGEQFESFRV